MDRLGTPYGEWLQLIHHCGYRHGLQFTPVQAGSPTSGRRHLVSRASCVALGVCQTLSGRCRPCQVPCSAPVETWLTLERYCLPPLGLRGLFQNRKGSVKWGRSPSLVGYWSSPRCGHYPRLLADQPPAPKVRTCYSQSPPKGLGRQYWPKSLTHAVELIKSLASTGNRRPGLAGVLV